MVHDTIQIEEIYAQVFLYKQFFVVAVLMPFLGDCSSEEQNVSGVSKSGMSTVSDLCQELEGLRLNASLSPEFDAVHGDFISASR